MNRKEECKNEYNERGNKLIDSKDFFFNYRNDEDFNKINVLETKPINKNYNLDNYFTFNTSLNNHTKRFIKNEYSYKKKNIFYDLKNSVNSIDSMKMKEISEEEKEIQNQIKYEEKRLNNLKEVKNRLIEEEKKRREMICDEINNNKNKIEEKKEEIKEILYECKKEKKDLQLIKDNKDIVIDNPNKSIFYKEYLEQIRKRNDLINQNSNEMIKQKINKENNSIKRDKHSNKLYYNIYNSYNKYKKIRKINNNNKHILKIDLNNDSINIRKRKKYDKNDIINLNSYFKLNEKEREKNFNYTSSDNIINNTALNTKRNYINLTPDGLYRSNKTENSKNNSSKIYKVLSSNNNNNYMTQTRFYRSRINPDELISHYAKEKVMNFNSSRNKSFIKNKNILIYPESINYSKGYSSYIKLNDDNKRKSFEEIYFNYDSNIFPNKRLSTYKSNSFLEKGKSCNNLTFQLDYDDNYLCDNCFRKKIFINDNLNNKYKI